MGIRLNNTVEMVILSHRRRRHRVESLNNIELKIQSIKYRGQQQDEDITLALFVCKTLKLASATNI